MSGCLLFAVSCYMNFGMDQNYGGRQFIFANIDHGLRFRNAAVSEQLSSGLRAQGL